MKKSATKVIASLFCVVLLLSCLTFQVSAQTVRDVEYFDDGSYVVTELTVNTDNPFCAYRQKRLKNQHLLWFEQ